MQVKYLCQGGHYIGDCIPTRDQGQSEVKRSRRNFGAGQAVEVGIGGSLETVKGSPSNQWTWLMLDSQGSRPDFRCGQGVKDEIWWVKILTAVMGGSIGDYVVFPHCTQITEDSYLWYDMCCKPTTVDNPRESSFPGSEGLWPAHVGEWA